MTKNEADFANLIVNYEKYVEEARQYIKENFGVYSVWDNEERSLELYVDNINESLQLMAAKEYLENNIEEGIITINI